MKRMQVVCGLCGQLVKLTKSGQVPEHPQSGWPKNRNRCNGVRDGLFIGLAAKPLNPLQQRWRREARARRLRYHQAGKSVENDPRQRNRWLYRNGWLPEQQRREHAYTWLYALKAGHP